MSAFYPRGKSFNEDRNHHQCTIGTALTSLRSYLLFSQCSPKLFKRRQRHLLYFSCKLYLFNIMIRNFLAYPRKKEGSIMQYVTNYSLRSSYSKPIIIQCIMNQALIGLSVYLIIIAQCAYELPITSVVFLLDANYRPRILI